MLDENKTEYCDCCGAPMRKYTHNLTPGLVTAFIKFVNAVKEKGVNDVHLATEVELTHNEHANFQKLRLFGLVHHADKTNIKSGRWLITRRGGEFIRAETPVCKQVTTYRNQLDKDFICDKMVWIFDYYRKTDKEYWQENFDFDVNQSTLL